MIQLLGEKHFRQFWTAQIFTQLGDGIIRTLIIFLVSALTQDPLLIGLVIFAQMLPMVFVGMFAGSLADRYSKRWILVFSNIFQCLAVGVMFFFQDQATILIGLMLLYGVGIAFYEPTRVSSIPFIVKENQVSEAVGFSQGSTQAMMIIGPGIAGLLFLADHISMIFLILITTYLIAALLLFRFKNLLNTTNKSEDTKQENQFSAIKNGVHQIINMEKLRFLLVLLIPITLGAGVLNTNINTLFLQTFQVSADLYGFLSSTFGVGAIIGALLAPYLIKKIRAGYMLIGTVGVLGMWMALILLIYQLEALIGISAVFGWAIMLGFLNASLNVPIGSLFISSTPSDFLGRGSALMQALVNIGTMSGILIGGWLAHEISAIYTTFLIGILLLISMIIFPLFKGFKQLNVATDEPGEEALQGVVGQRVFIPITAHQKALMQSLLNRRFLRLMGQIGESSLTMNEIAAALDEDITIVEEEVERLTEMGVLIRKSNDEDTVYLINKDNDFTFDIETEAAQQHPHTVLQAVKDYLEPGISLIEEDLFKKKGHHVMLSVRTDHLTESEWRDIHLNVMDYLGKNNSNSQKEQFEHKSKKSKDNQEKDYNSSNHDEQKRTYIYVVFSYCLEDSEKQK